MDHKITFQLVSGKDESGKPFTGYHATCSCNWGWPIKPTREESYPQIISHYRQHGLIFG